MMLRLIWVVPAFQVFQSSTLVFLIVLDDHCSIEYYENITVNEQLENSTTEAIAIYKQHNIRSLQIV